MKASELRELTIEELTNKGKELKNELFNLKFQDATGQIGNPIRIRIVRRDIARIETILNEKNKENKREKGEALNEGAM
ncbi:MAG TPA: 50S ribosomal protein L29 [Nitrospinota bacterium]|nr:50S ribosomal protein L29 [Nitrospinota bacterium]